MHILQQKKFLGQTNTVEQILEKRDYPIFDLSWAKKFTIKFDTSNEVSLRYHEIVNPI